MCQMLKKLEKLNNQSKYRQLIFFIILKKGMKEEYINYSMSEMYTGQMTALHKG